MPTDSINTWAFYAHYVYILQSLKDYKYYIGETAEVKARLQYHNKGLQRSTKSRTPFRLIKLEEYPDRSTA
ncbi:MAG: GIY-YIG nuclease family protein [Chitinophagaceae bacterium]|nr:GIY-YIG nuclease family protein [Chitinophagaceae bacterium]